MLYKNNERGNEMKKVNEESLVAVRENYTLAK